MYFGFFICIAFFLFGAMTALGYDPDALIVLLHPAMERVAIRPTQAWGTARAIKASAASLVSIVAFFFTISSM